MRKRVDWYYHRSGCQTCLKSQKFLADNQVTATETVDAKKVRFEPAEALKVVRQSDELWVAKGKSVKRLNLKDEPMPDGELLKLILGPSGKLRAPVIRSGRRMFIGFDADELANYLGE